MLCKWIYSSQPISGVSPRTTIHNIKLADLNSSNCHFELSLIQFGVGMYSFFSAFSIDRSIDWPERKRKETLLEYFMCTRKMVFTNLEHLIGKHVANNALWRQPNTNRTNFKWNSKHIPVSFFLLSVCQCYCKCWCWRWCQC